MSDLTSATPVRSNLAQMLLQLKELPPDVVSDGLNKFVALDKTPQFLKEVKEESGESTAASGSDNDEQIVQKIPTTEDTCNCRKSRCLKLYCQCFAAKIFCGANCNCEACANTITHTDLRLDAIKGILERNPNAFDSKFKAANVNSLGANGAHKTGCRCRKSMCLKKYCECFQLGVPCSPICTCLHCCNTADGAAFAGKTGQTAAATKISQIRKLEDGFKGGSGAADGEDLLRAASDLTQMRREPSQSGSSEDGSYRSSSPLSVEEQDRKPRAQGRKTKKQQSLQANRIRGQHPLSPRVYIDGSMPTSGGSPGPSMLSVLPPPRSLVIRAPPLSLPNGKRPREGGLGLDEMSPKSGGSSPNPHRLPKPSILNRPKSCPASAGKFDGLDPSVFKSKSPELQSSAISGLNYLSGQRTARSASPNTMQVVNALSLLCGLTGKSPENVPSCGTAPSSGSKPSLLPTGSPLVPSGLLVPVAPRPHSGSLGDRMDVTSEEDFCEISPAIDSEHMKKKTITLNVPPPIHESVESDSSGITTAPVVNFDQLSAGDGAATGESALSSWASPAVQVDRLSSWSKPAVELPRTPSEPGIYARELQRTATPIQMEN